MRLLKEGVAGPGSAVSSALVGLLLALMAVLAGGAALRESVTIDEVAHIGAGLSYLQKLDLRLNEEHPPLPKALAAIPLVLRGTRADYSHVSWTASAEFLTAFIGEWVFGEWVLTHWNEPAPTLAWARLPMLLLTLVLGGVIYACAKRLGGTWGGLLCLSLYVTAPVFLAIGPLVHTDIAVTLFSLLTVWTLADVWQEPTPRRVCLFGLAFSGALLSKFSAGILLLAFVAVALSLRWRPLPGQPADPAQSRLWRRRRSRAVWRGIGGAAVCVYAVYFVLSWNQSTDALDLLGHGSLIVPVRRLLMPPWLYLRGLLMMALTSSRPTFLLGHQYPHGVWFYFPLLLLLKSPLGFSLLLGLAGLAAIVKRVANRAHEPGVVQSECPLRWRVLWVSLLVFTAVCLASRLNISFRHFSVPLVLLILLMAPLPRLLGWVRERSALGAGLATALVAGLVLACFVTVVGAYPHYFPYISPFGLGRPGYVLVNDSNFDFNHALPEVARFAERHRLSRVPIDAFGLSDTGGGAELRAVELPTADAERGRPVGDRLGEHDPERAQLPVADVLPSRSPGRGQHVRNQASL